MEFLKKNSQIIGYIGCAALLLGCLLPFITVLGQSTNYITSGIGKVVVIVAIVSAILLYLKKGKIATILNIIIFLLFLLDNREITKIPGLKIGIGYYMIILGYILAIVASFFVRNEEK